MLLHAQDPILYIVRKQQRYSPTHVTPLASYHIIAGQVFQTPDIGTVINSRLVRAVANLLLFIKIEKNIFINLKVG